MIQSKECIICGAPLEYLEQPEEMDCAVCHRKFVNNVRCTGGHYVCDECHMHGPEHHIMVGSALITAYRNAGGGVDLDQALSEMVRRGRQVPGGACGNWGACGAGISTGMFVSIVTKSSPLATKAWSLGNLMTSRALERIAMNGGPRCCKRDSYLAVLTAIDFASEHLGVQMHKPDRILCSRSAMNNQCRGSKCPFHAHEFKIAIC